MWRTLLSKTFSKTSLTLDQPNCLRQRSKQHDCRLCLSGCPVQAIALENGKPELDKSKCLECGICCHLCPTQVFQQETEKLSHYEQLLQQKAVACFACHKQGRQADDILLPCLQVLAPEFLMLAYLKEIPVQIYWDPQTCNYCGCAFSQEKLKDWIHDWNLFIGQSAQIEIIASSELKRGKNKTISRRDFFTLSGNQFKKQIGYYLDASFEETPLRGKVPVPQSRLYLQKFLQRAEVHSRPLAGRLAQLLRLCTLTVQESCSLCGKCTVLCPTGALRIEQQEEQRQLVFEALRCLDCGICRGTCQSLARSALKASGKWMQPAVLKRGQRAICPACGGQMYGEQKLCPECRLKKEREEESWQTWVQATPERIFCQQKFVVNNCPGK